jgi:hypothetical protein
MILLEPRGLAALKEVEMSNLERVLHPVAFLSHLLHFPSLRLAVTRASSPDSVVDFSVTRDSATNNLCAGTRPGELDRDGCAVHATVLVHEMVMDLL